MKNNGCCKSVKDDYVVCTCMEVMHSAILEAISKGEDSFDKLSDSLGVGTGCSSCVQEVHEILKEEAEKNKKK